MKEFEKLNSSQLNYVRELLRSVLKYKLLEESRSYTMLGLRSESVKATEEERLFRAEKRNGHRCIVHIRDWEVVKIVNGDSIAIIERA